MRIGEYLEKPPEGRFGYYILAVAGGIAIFFLVLYIGKILLFIAGLIVRHWVWIIVAVISLIFLRKILTRKKRPLPVVVQNA